MRQTVVVALGGAFGSAARVWISLLLLPLRGHLPVETICINVAGSFVIGLFGTLTLEGGRYPLSELTRLFVMVGFCGGFTTFSAFSLETLQLWNASEPGWALANIAVSVLLCLGSVALGHGLASRFNGGAIGVAENAIEEEAS